MDSSSPISKNPGQWGVKINADGTYTVKIGLPYEEAYQLYFYMREKVALGTIRVSSNKFRYLSPGDSRRLTLHFLAYSNHFLSAATAVDRIRKRKLDTLFPIILGRTERHGKKSVLYPVNIKETCLINRCHPEKEVALDPVEKEIFDLANGTLSASHIILKLYTIFEKKYRKKYIYNIATKFFKNMFLKYCSIRFGCSWRDV